jgi:hypothetical protein
MGGVRALQVIGGRPIAGRGVRAEDEAPGAPAVVVLGYGVWNDRYVADEAIVGRTIRINGAPATVVGVMPESFTSSFPVTVDLWLPLGSMPGIAAQPRNARTLAAVGRLREGTELPHARAELTAAASQR